MVPAFKSPRAIEQRYHPKINVKEILQKHQNLDYKAYKPMLDKFMMYSHDLFEEGDKAFYSKQGLKVEDR